MIKDTGIPKEKNQYCRQSPLKTLITPTKIKGEKNMKFTVQQRVTKF